MKAQLLFKLEKTYQLFGEFGTRGKRLFYKDLIKVLGETNPWNK